PQTFTYPYQQTPLPPNGTFSEFGAYPGSPDPFHRAMSTAPGSQHPHSPHSPALYQTFASPPTPQPHPYFPPPPPPPQHLQQADPNYAWQHGPPTPAPFFIAFDPRAPEMTQSQFLGTLNHQQPQQVFAESESTMTIPLGSPSRPSSRASQYGPASPHAPSPQFPQFQQVQPPSQALSPPPASYTPLDARSPSPDRPLSSRGFRTAEEEYADQVAQNLKPAEAYSATRRAEEMVATEQRRKKAPSPAPAAPVPAPMSLQRTQSFTSTRSMRTPPPPSPSARYTSPAPSPVLPLFVHQSLSPQIVDPGLLETIGEDGESQAGTAKSYMLSNLAAALKADEEDNENRVKKPMPNSPSRNSVQDLEDFVEDEGKMKELDTKTLPPPPVPSERTKVSTSAVPRAQDIFARTEEVKEPEKPVQRAPSPPKVNLIPRSDGGLNKLESFLNRPTTPDLSSLPNRSASASPSRVSFPDRAASASPSRSNLVAFPRVGCPSRTLSPPIDPSALGGFRSEPSGLRARSLSRARSEKQLALLYENEDPKVALKKAMEGATPPPVVAASLRSRTASTPVRATTDEVKKVGVSSSRPMTLARMSSSVSTPSISANGKVADKYVAGRKVVDVEEVNMIKKEAVGRVSAWLKEDETPVVKEDAKKTPMSIKRATIDFVRPAPTPPKAIVAEASVTRPTSIPTPPSPAVENRPSPPTITAPEPSIEELLAKEPVTKMKFGGLAPPSSRKTLAVDGDEDLVAKYCVKSARGGRGGVVSSVAGLWGGKIEAEAPQRELTKSPPTVPKVLKVASTAPVAQPLRPVVPVDNTKRTNLSLRTMMDSNPAPIVSSPSTPRLAAARPVSLSPTKSSAPAPARLSPSAKRWSVPSPAPTFVNTTMGKPPALSRSPVLVAPARSQTTPSRNVEVKPVGKVTGGIANLIARYQQEVARP
ncbi:hypothetical protein P7C70_g8146, partial [Phenoliferia sp. Uapishka_3]